MKQFTRLALPALGVFIALPQSACSVMHTDDRPEVQYQRAYSAEHLAVPPDLSAPDLSTSLVVSGAQAGKIQRNTLLPEIEGVRFIRAGALGWLEVSAPAEKLWPLVREFILREGLLLKRDEPLSGYMETTWAEDKIAIPQTGLKSFFDTTLSVLTPTSELTSYVFRFERAAEHATRLFISQRTIEEQALGNTRETEGEFAWVAQDHDPGREAALLIRLMVYLGIDAQRAQGILSDAEVAQLESPAYLVKTEQRETALFVSKTFSLTWPAVSAALEELNFRILSDDIDTGRFELSYAGAFYENRNKEEESTGFFDSIVGLFGSSSDNIQGYQVRLDDRPGGTYVTVSNGDGDALSPEEEHALLDAIRLQLI